MVGAGGRGVEEGDSKPQALLVNPTVDPIWSFTVLSNPVYHCAYNPYKPLKCCNVEVQL